MSSDGTSRWRGIISRLLSRTFRRQLFVVLGLLAVAGLLVAATGVVPLKASSGHWAITERLLQFGKRRSVETNARGIEVPPLDDPGLVMQGAGHFDVGCSPCHGSPGLWAPRIPLSMTPNPPPLDRAREQWRTRELFYMTKHGLKFTGMPAWPAQERDDEVWAIVAFMLKLGDLDPASYAELVGEREAAAELRGIARLDQDVDGVTHALAVRCARCHGADGQGRLPGAFPILAGQSARYTAEALAAYAAGTRNSGIMEPIAAALAQVEREGLAAYYQQLGADGITGVLAADSLRARRHHDDEAVRRGARIAFEGVPARDVPACVQCHGPSSPVTNDAYPLIAGQDYAYLVRQLDLLRSGKRGGGGYREVMHIVVSRMTAEQVRDVAAFYASLGGAGR
ncbi:MAG: c-type cytochrome [Gemmatimonadota bacterium]